MNLEYSTGHANDDMLYRELYTPLFHYVFFRTRNRELADDLTQASFLKYLLQKEKPTEKAHARRLLFTIARTTLIDYWRTEGKRNHVSLEDAPEEPQSELLGPQDEAVLADDTQYIRSLLDGLTTSENEIVSLRISGDIDYDEIAEIVGVSAQNARQIYSRSLKKIKIAFESSSYFN